MRPSSATEEQADLPNLTLRADGIRVDDGVRPLLPTTSLTVGTGHVGAAVGDPGHAHTALCLALAGRLPLSAGGVITSSTSSTSSTASDQRPRDLQRLVGLVDVPGVSEPDDAVGVQTVIGEELAMARHSASRNAVRTVADDLGIALHGRFDHLAPPERVRLLLRLAALRPGVRFLALCLPERYGALPGDWLPEARELAAHGFGVLVTVGRGTAAAVPHDLSLTTIGSEVLA